MLGREPVLLATGIATLLQGAAMLYFNDITVTGFGFEGLLLPAVTFLSGILARSKVMPVKTIEQAGLTTEGIKARAGDAP